MNHPIDITGLTLKTPRLTLRPFQNSDLQDLYEYAKVDGVGQMAGWLPHKTIDDSRVILDMFIRSRRVFAIELKETGKVIGSLGIEEPDPDPEPEMLGQELGFVLHREYWGRELMPEAVKERYRFFSFGDSMYLG